VEGTKKLLSLKEGSSDITDRVFDCVIDVQALFGVESAMKLVRPKGTIVLKTTAAKRDNIDMNIIVIDEITLVGSRCGPFEPAIHALEMKTIDVLPLISRTFPLSEGVEAFNFASGKGILKVLLKA
jgi:threonine dehydrogenase-like Zn-dependent dehydrogenase